MSPCPSVLKRFSSAHKFPLWVANLNIGVIYILALASVGTYGVILGGWASNNKYSLMGGFRSAAQMISYEIPMAFAVITVVLMAGSLNLSDIVNAQTDKWFLFTPGRARRIFPLYRRGFCRNEPYPVRSA